jgi:hypothetical protein
MCLNKVGNGKDSRLQSRRICGPCEAWMHFAGGETSAQRPGITRMMFLVVFFCVAEKRRRFRRRHGDRAQKSARPGTRG